MIVDDCEQLVTRIAEKERLRRHVEQLNRFDRVGEQLEQAVSRLSPLLLSCASLKESAIADITLPSAKTLRDETASVLALFQGDREAILDATRFKPKAFTEAVKTLTDELQIALDRAWQAYAGGRALATNRELLDVLERLPKFRPVVQRIRSLSEKIRQAQAILPTTKAQVDEFNRLVTQAEQAWQELGGEQMPQEVLDFLKAAISPAGSRLGFLTDAVRSWLTQHGIASSFVVKVSG